MDYLLAFIIASSIIILFITYLYLGTAYVRAGRPKHIPFEYVMPFIGVMYGMFNVLNVYLQRKGFGPNISLLVGATMGELFSIIGRFGYNLPVDIFGFKKENEYMVHIIAPILYGIIFRFGLQPLNKKYLL